MTVSNMPRAIAPGATDSFWSFVAEFESSVSWRYFVWLFKDEDRARDALVSVIESSLKAVKLCGLTNPRAYFRRALSQRAIGSPPPAVVIGQIFTTTADTRPPPDDRLLRQEHEAAILRLVADLPEPIRAYATSGAPNLKDYVSAHPELGSYERAKKLWQRAGPMFLERAIAEELLAA